MSDSSDFEIANQQLNIIRGMIQHEDQLLNHRLSWMWTLQSILLGSVVFLWSSQSALLVVIAFVGLTSCISIGYSIKRGMTATTDLLKLAKEIKGKFKGRVTFSPTIGSRSTAVVWLLPGNCLPWITGLSWCGLVAIKIVELGKI